MKYKEINKSCYLFRLFSAAFQLYCPTPGFDPNPSSNLLIILWFTFKIDCKREENWNWIIENILPSIVLKKYYEGFSGKKLNTEEL